MINFADPDAPAKPPVVPPARRVFATPGDVAGAVTGALDKAVAGNADAASAVGGALGKAAQGAVSPITDSAKAIYPHLPKAMRNSIKNAAKLTGSGLQEASNVFGIWQDTLGATARDVQEGGIKNAFVAGPHQQAMYDDFRNALHGKGKLEDVNAKYQIFSPTTLDALKNGEPGAIASVAKTLRDNPHLAGLASLVTEFANPATLAAGDLAQGGVAAARGIGGAIAREPHIAAAVANARAGAAATTPLEHAAGAVTELKDKFGRRFNAYHDVEKTAAPRGALEWREKHEVGQAAATKRAEDVTKKVFSDLTRPQKIEVQQRLEGTAPKLIPNPVKGPSLDERVQTLRDYQDDLDARLTAEDPRLIPNKSEAPFFSRRGTKDQPVYTDDAADERFKPSVPKPGGGGSSGSMSVAAGARGPGERTFTTLQDALDNGKTLHPSYDPAAQYARTAAERERSLAAQQSYREAEHIPAGVDSDGNPVNLRQNYRYQLTDEHGNILKFANEDELRAYARRENRPAALRDVLAANGVAAIPRVPQSSRYLKGVLDATATQGAQMEKIGARTGRAFARAGNAVQPQKIADALAPQTARIDALGKTIAAHDTNRAEFQDIGKQFRGKITDLRGDYRAAQNVAKGPVYKSGEGADVDKLAAKIAAHRIDRPAGTNLSTFERDGQTHVLGNPSSFRGTQYAKTEVQSVRAALDRARKGKLIPEGGVKPAKATNEDAVRFLDQHANAIGEARARTEASLDANKLRYKNAEGRRVAMTDAQKSSVLKDHLEQHVDTHEQLRAAAAKLHPIPQAVKRSAAEVANGQRAAVKRVTDAAVAQAAAVHGVAPKVVREVADATQKTANDLSTLFAKLAQSKTDETQRDLLNRQLDSTLNEYIERTVTRGKLKPRGLESEYGAEGDLHLRTVESTAAPKKLAVDSSDKLLHKSLYHSIEQAHNMGAPEEEATALGRAFVAAGSLARAGIIYWPTTHAIWNLGRAFLAEGGDIRAMFANDEKANFWREQADKTGASPSFTQHSFGLGPERSMTVATTPGRSLREMLPGAKDVGKLSRRGTVDRALSGAFDMNQKLVFGVFERRYAGELLRKFVEDDGMDMGQAVRRVRKALGDYNNITAFEQQFSRMFLFYPWMKTVIPFWAKKGFFDPRQWNAPITAVRQNNEGMGDPNADHATNPWRMDAWGDAAHGFTYLGLPDPARVDNATSTAARAPLDFFRGITTRNSFGRPEHVQGFGALAADAEPTEDYVRGHIAPVIAPIVNALFPGGKYQRLGNKPDDPAGQQLGDAAKQIGSGLFAPSEGIQNWLTEPASAALAGLTGGFVGHTNPPTATMQREKIIRDRAARAIDKARARGNYDAVARLTLQLHKHLQDLGSESVAPVSAQRSPIVPPAPPAPAAAPIQFAAP